jgi:hypothetical protein
MAGSAGLEGEAIRRRAAAIYGCLITAALLVAFGGGLSTAAAVVVVVVTLVVYWLAEDYAHLLSEQRQHGTVPTWASIRSSLVVTRPIVSVSFVPLLALVLARVFGASAFVGANIGLAIAVALLTFDAWLAARAARLDGHRQVFASLIGLGLGITMIVLKDVVLLYLK